MWECKRCKHRNNNSSEKCHGQNCKAERKYEALFSTEFEKAKELKEKRQVMDFCPKCKKETTWDYIRTKKNTKQNLVNFRVGEKKKMFRCLECGAIGFPITKNKPIIKEVSS